MEQSTPQLSLVETIATINWPRPELAGLFLQDVDHMWGTEAGRAEVERWLKVLGKPSQFVEGQLWTASQMREHWQKWDEWHVEEEKAKKPLLHSSDRAVSRSNRTDNKKAVSTAWHKAVADKREAMRLSLELMHKEIATARQRHTQLAHDWDEYIAAVRGGRVTVQNVTQ